MPDLTLQHDSPHPIEEVALTLRQAWRERRYPVVRISLLSLASILRNPHDERRCILLLAAVARQHHDRKTEADAFWLLAALEEREGKLGQGAGDYLKASALLDELGFNSEAERCRGHLERMVRTWEARAVA